jgi:hypothetical protein
VKVLALRHYRRLSAPNWLVPASSTAVDATPQVGQLDMQQRMPHRVRRNIDVPLTVITAPK